MDFNNPPQDRFVDVDGISTRYFDVGSGPATVVLIYGGNFGSFSSALEWIPTIPALAERCRVIALDKPGQGLTAASPRAEDFTMSAVIRHIARFVNVLGLGRYHLVGHSRGGFAATRLAIEDQANVRSLTICSSGTLSTGVGVNEVVLADPPYAAGTREAIRWVYENYCSRPEHVQHEWIDAAEQVLQNPVFRAGANRYSNGMHSVSRFFPELASLKQETLDWIRAGRLQRPVQIIWGAQDNTLPVSRGLELFKLISLHERRCTFNVINDAGHYTFMEQPGRFNALLSSFVEQCEAQA